MKTFAEALEAVTRKADTDDELKAVHAAMEVFTNRWREILNEAVKDPQFVDMMQGLLGAVQARTLPPTVALTTCFVNGLIVGLEMNRLEMD